MLCTQCHTSNSIDYNFCRECGLRLAGGTPGDPQTEQLLARAFAFLDQGQYQEARDAAAAALALDPESASAHSILGLAHEREGNITEAIREYEIVLERNPRSTADRLKLEALRGGGAVVAASPRWSPRQVVLTSAALAAMLVFGCGYLVVSQLSKPDERRVSADAIRDARAALPVTTSALVPGADPAQSGRPILPLPTPPTPLQANNPNQLAPPAARTPATPVMPTTGAMRAAPGIRASAPIGPLALPGASDRTPDGSGGLAPAGIGEVVPLPQAPATAPGGPAIASGGPGAAPPAGGSAPAAAPTAPSVGSSSAAHDPGATNEKPKRELLEPETGFIKIEPIGGPAEPRASLGAPRGPAPSISLNFVSSEADGATLGDAQRAQRSALAAKRSNPEDAERLYRQAIGLYEILARRGGSTGKTAREGLDECRKALQALR